MDFVVSNPTWLAIICFGVVAIISGIMLTGRDLDPIERVLPSISSIQKWCGIGIFLAAIFVFLASPLPGKHLLEAEQAAVTARNEVAVTVLAEAIGETVVEELNQTIDENTPEMMQDIATAIGAAMDTAASSGWLGGTTQEEIVGNSASVANAVVTEMTPVLDSFTMSEEDEAALAAGIAEGIEDDLASYATASPGALTNKADVTFYNPLSAIWGTMLGIFAIMVLVFSQVTAKYGDQKPLSTMLAALWPVVLAMCFYTWKLKSGSEYIEGSDTPGVMLCMFILLLFAAFAIPLCVLGMREKPREAGEYGGYLFIIMGIWAIGTGIYYLWKFEVDPFIGFV